jgi:hypothetical protein
MSSGGARTFMGTTITPPEDSYLLVKYSYLTSALVARGQPVSSPSWQSCRRFIVLDSAVIIEGLNYDGRAKDQERDVNELLPHTGLASFQWKYEARPAPPAGSAPARGGRPTRQRR